MAPELRQVLEEYDILFDGGKRVQLINRRTVMQAYDFPSIAAVRMFAKRHRIPHVMVGRRALYRPSDWEQLRAPATSSPGPARK